MDKIGRGGALALAVALALSGCRRDPAPPVTATPMPTAVPTAQAERMVFALPYAPEGELNPITGSDRVNLTWAPLVYRGLFTLDGRFGVRQELCEGYEVSEDGLVWTFTLAGATFSDGSPLTAREVVASLDLARSSPRFATRLSRIKSLAVQDDAVVVKLSAPYGELPLLLDVPVVKETGEGWPLGTGDYFLFQGESGLELIPRSGVAAPVRRIALYPISGGDDLIYAFDAGLVTLVDTDLTGANPLGYSGRFETTDYPTTTLLYLGFQTGKGSLCSDLLLRRAVAQAVDRGDVVSRLLAGHAVAARYLLHPLSASYTACLPEREPEYATRSPAELLSEAGWKREGEEICRKGRTELALRLAVNQENSYKVGVAQSLAAALEELGCAVTVERLPWEDFSKALREGKFDLYLGETSLGADLDPGPLAQTGGALNFGRFSDPELDGLLESWRQAEGEERSQLSRSVQETLARELPLLPLCFKNGSVLTRWGVVQGMTPTQRDIFAAFSHWKIQS